MKQNFIKTFVSALAGSILLVVAMFAMNAMRPETQVVQAATAVQAPALAATDSVTVWTMPYVPVYGEAFELYIVRSAEDAATAMDAEVWIDGKQYGTATTLPADEVTSTVEVDATDLYPGKHNMAVTLDNGKKVEQEITVQPVFKFDSGVPTMIKLGDCYTADVKIQPEVNYMSKTNEMVDYTFGDDSPVASVLITDTSAYTKADRPDSTYVFTRHRYYVGGMTYTVKAEYKSGIYGESIVYDGNVTHVTQTLHVENPMVTVGVQNPDGEAITTAKSGDKVRVWGKTSYPLSPTMMMLNANMAGSTMPMLAYTENMTGEQTMVYTDIMLPAVTQPTTISVGSQLQSMMYGTPMAPLPNGQPNPMRLIDGSDPVTVVVHPAAAKVAEVDLSAEPTSDVKAGESYTVTATLMDTNSNPVTNTNVMFKVTDADSDAEIKTENETSDDAGKAEITVTSSEVATYTVIAVSEGVTSTKQLTLKFVSGENTKQIDPTKDEDVEMTSEDGKVTITIESGTFTETVDIVFEEASENDADVQGKIGSLKAKTRFGFFRIKIYRVVDGKRGDQFFPVLTKPIKIVYNRLTVASTMLQQTNTVPLNEVQLLKMATYTTSWNNMDTTVSPSSPSAGDALTLTGSTTQPGELFAVVTANNEVYLPTVSK